MLTGIIHGSVFEVPIARLKPIYAPEQIAGYEDYYCDLNRPYLIVKDTRPVYTVPTKEAIVFCIKVRR